MSVRGYTSFPFQGFGRGLNLRDKPDAVDLAEAIDCIDVTFTDRGAIEERAGYKALTGSALTNRVASLEAFYSTGGITQLLAGCGTRLEGLSSAGAVVDSETGLTGAIWDFARFGKPNSEVAYAGNGNDTLRKWDGAEWTAPTASVDGVGAKTMPRAGSICVNPSSNRLVCGGFETKTGGPGGAESSPSHVYESEAGNPEGYESSAYVQYTPGDGEKVMACVSWREFTFIFKETKFFVRHGDSVDGEGKPILTYRPIDTGIGLASKRAICVHETGVYFMSRHGVYRTTGQEPEEVSQIIEPIWSGLASPFFTGGTLAQSSITECAMGTYEDRIYLSYPVSGAITRVLVFDPLTSWWSLYSLPASCLTSFRPEGKTELVFGYASGENLIGRHYPGLTSDAGAQIKSFWRQAWLDLGNPDVKTIRDLKLWGTGKIGLSLDTDFVIQAGEPTEIDMSGSTGEKWAEGEGLFGVGDGLFADVAQDLLPAYCGDDARGTVLSLRFSGLEADQPWSVHRVDLHLREVAKPDTVAA